MRWEYLVVSLGSNAPQILDECGKTGWELVSVIPPLNGSWAVAYFKRPR